MPDVPDGGTGPFLDPSARSSASASYMAIIGNYRTPDFSEVNLDLAPFAADGDRDVEIEEIEQNALLSLASLRAYRADWRDFSAWCAQNAKESLPAEPETIISYLADRATTLKVSTLTRRLATISWRHDASGFNSPTAAPLVRRTLKRLRRQYKTRINQKAPLTLPLLKELLPLVPETLTGRRDKAILLLGFAGGFRRSELSAITLADCTPDRQGWLILLPQSKTDQEGAGRIVPVPFGKDPDCCPILALVAWLAEAELRAGAAAIKSGPLFREIDRHGNIGQGALSAKTISRIIKHYIAAAGMDADRYSGHSLRAGLVTSAAAAGADDKTIMRTTGHKSREMVDRYVRSANIWNENAATRAGL